MINRLPLGAPGIYELPPVPLRALTGVRMDVCAFVGVAPRGPARVPIIDPKHPESLGLGPGDRRRRSVATAVESLDECRRLYGGFEGPGLLPYAVASFFDQGGRRAYIVRIVHDYSRDHSPATAADLAANDAGVAAGDVPGVVRRSGGLLRLRARSEGAWGNRLRAVLSFHTRPLVFETATTGELTLAADVDLPAGTLLRLTFPGGARALRFVATVWEDWQPETGRRERHATFDHPTAAAPERAEIVEGALTLDDHDGRVEQHEGLGLSARHPRWMATVLCDESILAYPDPAWIEDDLVPDDPRLPSDPVRAVELSGGVDRYPDIVPEDFFDDEWVADDDERPADGVQALVEIEDVSLLVVPDLYSPAPLAPIEPVNDPGSMAGPTFEPCVPSAPAVDATPLVPGLDGLSLDPRLPADLRRIGALQQRLVDLAERLRSFIVLLDVPPGLHQRQILAWRAQFGSAFAAAYHPWLHVARPDDRRDALIRVNPAAVAAGIIAQREIAHGVPFGPANVIAASVVNVEDAVAPARHDELHQEAINVFLRERHGIRLTAGRTLSRDPDYRQLSVRRLMTMLCRVLEQQMQWMVFEPNTEELRNEVRHLVTSYLRQLFFANAFTGAREDEAFFVRCDEALNPRAVVDAGRLVAEIGVAPAEPMEFLVLTITREADGTVQVEG